MSCPIPATSRRPGSFCPDGRASDNHPAYFVRRDDQWRSRPPGASTPPKCRQPRALVALGVQPGQAVCILGFNRPEWAIVVYRRDDHRRRACRHLLDQLDPEISTSSTTPGALPAGRYRRPRARSPRCASVCQPAAGRAHGDGRPTDGATLGWEDFPLGRPGTAGRSRQTPGSHPVRPTRHLHLYASGTTGPAKAVELSRATWPGAHGRCAAHWPATASASA